MSDEIKSLFVIALNDHLKETGERANVFVLHPGMYLKLLDSLSRWELEVYQDEPRFLGCTFRIDSSMPAGVVSAIKEMGDG